MVIGSYFWYRSLTAIREDAIYELKVAEGNIIFLKIESSEQAVYIIHREFRILYELVKESKEIIFLDPSLLITINHIEAIY